MSEKIKIKKEKKRIPLPKKPHKIIEDKRTYNRKKLKKKLNSELESES